MTPRTSTGSPPSPRTSSGTRSVGRGSGPPPTNGWSVSSSATGTSSSTASCSAPWSQADESAPFCHPRCCTSPPVDHLTATDAETRCAGPRGRPRFNRKLSALLIGMLLDAAVGGRDDFGHDEPRTDGRLCTDGPGTTYRLSPPLLSPAFGAPTSHAAAMSAAVLKATG